MTCTVKKEDLGAMLQRLGLKIKEVGIREYDKNGVKWVEVTRKP